MLQILLFLPLTLATLSTPAFLLLSMLLWIHSLVHGSILLFWRSNILSVLQVPMHPCKRFHNFEITFQANWFIVLLLVCFNAFSESPNSYLLAATYWWGAILTYAGPLFIAMEGLSGLLVVQQLGQAGKRLINEREEDGYQFGLLITAAIAYVASAWWVVAVCACVNDTQIAPIADLPCLRLTLRLLHLHFQPRLWESHLRVSFFSHSLDSLYDGPTSLRPPGLP